MNPIRPTALPLASAAPARVAAPGGGGGFRVAAERDAATAAAVGAASLTGLLALQEAEGEPPRDRAARRRGRDLLAALKALQRALLGGGDMAQGLADLAALAADVPAAVDPALAAAVAAVALRARVELAHFGTG